MRQRYYKQKRKKNCLLFIKEEMLMKKKYLKTCISVLAVTAVLLSACGGPQQKNVGKTTMETAKLADSIRKKYNEKYEYAEILFKQKWGN